jgi:glyoxylase I family protein
MVMPRFSDVSHVSLSVRDAERTARWWKDVFGLRELVRIDHDEGWHGILLELTPAIAIEFQQHDANGGEAFDPVRTGFDHMGLAVGSRADLLEWQAHFESLGVVHTPIADREYGSVLTFKDPDLIQFEMFYLDPEFEAAATSTLTDQAGTADRGV